MTSPAPIAPTTAERWLAAAAAAGADRVEPDWLRATREQAVTSLRSSGFPAPDDEAWRTTNVERVTQGRFTRLEPSAELPAELLSHPLLELPYPRLVLIDGRFSERWSRLPALDGLQAGGLADRLRQTDGPVPRSLGTSAHLDRQPFTALNAAGFDDGAFVSVARGVAVSEPLLILHLFAAAAGSYAVHPRSLIVLEPEARLTVVEAYLSRGDGELFINSVTESLAASAADLTLFTLQDRSAETLQFHRGATRVDREGRASQFTTTLGGRLTRNDTDVVLAGEGAAVVLDGVYAPQSGEHVDNHTLLDHAAPHGKSREVYKGVLAGSARAVFNGRILVRPHAQRTDAVQRNGNLLLSDTALINTRPQLEIYANDVKCTHGATIGKLPQEALFYLRTRGIGAAEARRMLIEAFIAEAIPDTAPPALRELIQESVARRCRVG